MNHSDDQNYGVLYKERDTSHYKENALDCAPGERGYAPAQHPEIVHEYTQNKGPDYDKTIVLSDGSIFDVGNIGAYKPVYVWTRVI